MTGAVACTLAVALAFAPPPAQARPSRDRAAAQAESLYNAGEFAAAAAAFEALAESRVRYLYFAGLAREALGHDGQAILHWSAVAESEQVEAPLREMAAARIDRARQRTTRLRVTVTPAHAAAGATARLVYQGGGDRQPLVVPVEQLAEGVQLESGPWEVQLSSAMPEYEGTTREVQLRLEDAEAAVVVALPPVEQPVALTIAPAEAAEAGLHLSLRPAHTSRRPASFRLREPTSTLKLGAGRWAYQAEAPGFAALAGQFTVEPGQPTTLALELRPLSNSPLARPKADHRLAVAAWAASGALALGGGLALGLSRPPVAACVREETCAPHTVRHRLDGMQLGSLALGASAGFLVTSLTATIERGEARRRAWIAEAALGGALTGVGASVAAWAFFANQRARLDAPRFDPRALYAYEVETYPAMLALGTGAALVVGSIAGAALERRRAGTRRAYARRVHVHSHAPLHLSF